MDTYLSDLVTELDTGNMHLIQHQVSKGNAHEKQHMMTQRTCSTCRRRTGRNHRVLGDERFQIKQELNFKQKTMNRTKSKTKITNVCLADWVHGDERLQNANCQPRKPKISTSRFVLMPTINDTDDLKELHPSSQINPFYE